MTEHHYSCTGKRKAKRLVNFLLNSDTEFSVKAPVGNYKNYNALISFITDKNGVTEAFYKIASND